MKPSRLAFLAAAAFSLSSGCSKSDEKTMMIDTPDGKLKVTAQGDPSAGKMTIDTPQGKITVDGETMKTLAVDKDGKEHTSESTTKIDAAAFDGMMYPKYEQDEGTGMQTSKSAQGSMASASFNTTDAPEKVVEHYKKLIPGVNVMAAGPATSLYGATASGTNVQISVTGPEGPGKTSVVLTVIKKS